MLRAGAMFENHNQRQCDESRIVEMLTPLVRIEEGGWAKQHSKFKTHSSTAPVSNVGKMKPAPLNIFTPARGGPGGIKLAQRRNNCNRQEASGPLADNSSPAVTLQTQVP